MSPFPSRAGSANDRVGSLGRVAPASRMPEKSLTVVTYAAGASLAAITLIYVFAPTYFLDSGPSASSHPLSAIASRKKGVVGLANAANDCFINSVLQALAGLGDLRLYLIRETHRRNIEDPWVYSQAAPAAEPASSSGPAQSPRRPLPAWKVEGLQRGLVTSGLKEILDQLNERPIQRKTISAVPFVRVLETAFRQRISRQQQDAQEFLQVVAERLCDEYHAGQRARRFARRRTRLGVADDKAATEVEPAPGPSPDAAPHSTSATPTEVSDSRDVDEEDGFPMEGKIESQIECLTCGFKPRPSSQAFCTLTLNVPQLSSTSLNACFDGMFKTEYIDEFKCERCRLVHAKERLQAEVAKSASAILEQEAVNAISRLEVAIETDPEKAPEGVDLPDARYAPKRKIARHIRLTSFPKILAIHLSRSIYDSSQVSLKNSAKVSFPERLPLGGLLQQRKYKLLGVVTHKGSHHSGHYESFRRQNVYPPFSNPNTFGASEVYSRSSTPAATPRLGATERVSREGSPLAASPDLPSPTGAHDRSTPSPDSTLRLGTSLRNSPTPTSARRGPTSAPRGDNREKDQDSSSLRSLTRSTLSRISPSSRSGSGSGSGSGAATPTGRKRTGPSLAAPGDGNSAAGEATNQKTKAPRRKHHDRWWRISDDKVREASTREVLGMQREVYLLFYELERSP